MAWEVKKLNKVGSIFSGNSINENLKKEKYLDVSDGLPYVATKDISYDSVIDYENGIRIPEKDLDKFRIAHKNSILICAEGGSAGRKLAFNNEDICFVNKLFALEPFDFMEPRYIYYFYHTSDFQEQFKSKMTGLIGGVSIGKFKEIDIPIPPLPIQKKIVKLLDSAFEKITTAKENSEQNLQNAKDVFESSLRTIFSSHNWKEANLGDHNDVVVGYVGPISKEYTNNPEDVILLSTKNVHFEGINLDKLTYINRKFHEKNKKSQLSPGDILVSRHGESGQAAMIPESIKEAHALNVIVVKKSKDIDSKFICYLFNSKSVDKITKSKNGSVQKIINTFVIKDLIIPLPSFEEQKVIVSKLDNLSEQTKQLESIYSKKLDCLKELKQSILQKAFKGELTEALS